jgi:hypothetical protein
LFFVFVFLIRLLARHTTGHTPFKYQTDFVLILLFIIISFFFFSLSGMPRSVSQLQAYSEVSELTTLPVTPPPLQSVESSAASREGESDIFFRTPRAC